MASATSVTPLDAAALRELESSFGGQLVRPDDPEYAEARRVWNGSIDRRPALVARCSSTADVVAALAFGRRSGLTVAVRSGGHSFPGHSVADDAFVIDLRPMQRVEVEPERGAAHAQAGVLLGELDAATHAHGLAVPAGIVTHTGLAGLTLGGGIGWLMRKYGLTVDQLLGVELVTADGEVVRASAGENADLFWGVRGGGGNFGVVTEFEFRLNPLGPVLAGPIFWPMEHSGEVLRFYREWIAEAPDDLMTIVIHRKAPPAPWIPAELHGRLVVGVVCCWTGAHEEGERVLQPLRRFGSPVLDACTAKPFLELQAMFDPSFVPGWWYYMRSCDVAVLTDDVIDITVEHSLRIQSPLTSFPIWQRGGVSARVAEDVTAAGDRGVGHTYNITSATATKDGFDAEREWVRSFWNALAPYHTSVYVNFLMDEGESRVRDAYAPGTYDRLLALKRRYDPDNVFRLNQNIAPA